MAQPQQEIVEAMAATTIKDSQGDWALFNHTKELFKEGELDACLEECLSLILKPDLETDPHTLEEVLAIVVSQFDERTSQLLARVNHAWALYTSHASSGDQDKRNQCREEIQSMVNETDLPPGISIQAHVYLALCTSGLRALDTIQVINLSKVPP
ncbi:hypothetical protein BDZ45DRAFT_742955 [Acephala macrosclerotiorum]|nr:hypothetical protein BDZ45DRAFT_742955 [Acephala macrosclerotiorum]